MLGIKPRASQRGSLLSYIPGPESSFMSFFFQTRASSVLIPWCNWVTTPELTLVQAASMELLSAGTRLLQYRLAYENLFLVCKLLELRAEDSGI